MAGVKITQSEGRTGLAAAAWPTSFLRMAFTVPWVCLGVAGVSAVAAAAIYLPLPHGRTVMPPDLRSSFAMPTPDTDFTDTWRDRTHVAALNPRAGQESSWMPEGGMSTLLARRFPSSGHVRFDVAAPLPPSRPDIKAEQDVASLDVPNNGVVRTMPVAPGPQLAALPPQPKADPGILDKLFGDSDRAAKDVIAANPRTVLYDITKRAVYMPDGEKLEAHSGFGEFMDDPDSMHRKNVGVTPPNVYTVSFREKPFHGVRALRMKPVGGGNMYNRDGFLTHSFLLGPNGQSNGCISLKDYDKFLQAYEDGKFDRIIVLRSVDEPLPSMVASNQAQGSGTPQ
ncbi:MAG: DUF2778 domain-containing protein [Pseudolabrys sp.]|nr:DUF2778 domain-containing protein [Pseudolabrys sp.]